ncbi:MAG TPA: adenylate/guanylate cyclase domain-containing protein [Gaiellaceae bacterium]|nr:adenylate/guanylate cyclase domain-containing protein [Gaiellaceae bacterium]
MSACAQCGFENAPGRKFCGGCGTALALACPSCGASNEPGTRFCGECGSPLTADAPAAAPAAAAERRIVTVLFADLVGFTPLSESRDAEEVRELLSRYFDRCRRLIEIYGGTVEKFIGDAVMAVWGTPVAQEDDAERAVRTALDLVAAVAALGEEVGDDLQARAGVLTGEAAVTLNAQAEGMVAGDLVNTAARIQSAAEPGSVLVGDATRRASDAAIAYEDAGSFDLKGKSEPMALFRAVRLMSLRRGTVRSGELEPPFVGRLRELNLVKELFHATAEDRKAHLVSLVGIGGIGKSRLAWEFEKYLDGVAETAYWHRGRCLAYGDGVAYWALAEMVRMRALISEEDTAEEGLAKLAAMLDQWLPDPDERAWVEPRLQQLLCLCDPEADERQNLFSAWRLFFERLAAQGPVVLVFEDLQWADASLLDFADHLLDWSRAHPIFVLALARPEIAQRRPGFGAGGTTLSLEPLSERAMGELLDGFVPGLPDDLRRQILERAEGVPLYAVETVRMLLDRGLLARDGEVYRPTGPIDALDVPETLHALVAARIDGLSPEERSLLQDAAVLGKSFTKPGLAALSGLDDAALDQLLTALVRKEVLSVQADPRSPERGQYAFVQDLLKRIAYDTLSRPERKARHLAAAAHLERTAAAVEAELVEVIAAHYLDAYEAAPDADDAAVLRAKAAEQLTLAGERAAALAATEEAQRYYEKAAALAADDLARADLLERAGLAAFAGARYVASVEHLDATATLYNAAGQTHSAAKVTGQIGLVMWRQGDLRAATERIAQALEVLADDQPDEEIAGLVEMHARLTYFLGDHDLARERVERALEIAEALPAPDVLSNALNTKSLLLYGNGRYEEGSALLDRAISIGRKHELGQTLLRAINNRCVDLSSLARFPEMVTAATEGAERSARLGHREHEQQFLSFIVLASWFLGDWDACDALVERFTAPGPYPTLFRTMTIVFPQSSRGRLDECRGAFAELEPFRTSEDAQIAAGVYRAEGVVLHAEGRFAEAAAALRTGQEVLSAVHPRPDSLSWSFELESLADAGDADALEERLAVRDAMSTVERTAWIEAVHTRFRGRLLALRGDRDGAAEELAAAARRYEALGTRFHEAATLVELAEASGETVPAGARATLQRLDARPWLERADALERAATV